MIRKTGGPAPFSADYAGIGNPVGYSSIIREKVNIDFGRLSNTLKMVLKNFNRISRFKHLIHSQMVDKWLLR